MHWSLSILVHTVSAAVCVNPVSCYDETPCDFVKFFRYSLSYRKQEVSPKCRSTFDRIYVTSPEMAFYKIIILFTKGESMSVPCYICVQIDTNESIRR